MVDVVDNHVMRYVDAIEFKGQVTRIAVPFFLGKVILVLVNKEEGRAIVYVFCRIGIRRKFPLFFNYLIINALPPPPS